MTTAGGPAFPGPVEATSEEEVRADPRAPSRVSVMPRTRGKADEGQARVWEDSGTSLLEVSSGSCRWSEPRVLVKYPLRVGDRWTQSIACGARNEIVRRVLRFETVRIEDRHLRCAVIEEERTTRYDRATSHARTLEWFSDELGLFARTEATARLEQDPPAAPPAPAQHPPGAQPAGPQSFESTLTLLNWRPQRP